jgi:hypothetical protein
MVRSDAVQQSVEVIFDGELLRPVEPLDLEPNQRYRVTIERQTHEGGVLDDIVALAGNLDLPSDFAAQHDHYLYGTPKR